MEKIISTFHSGKYILNCDISKNTEAMLNAIDLMLSLPLSSEAKSKITEQLEAKTVYSITALNLSKVTYEQVTRIITHKRSNFSQDASSVETINVFCAMEYATGKISEQLSPDIISSINIELTDNLPMENSGGQYRKNNINEPEETNKNHQPASALDINLLMKNLTEWLGGKDTKHIHPLIKGLLLHLHIKKIAPYKNFNFKTALCAEFFLLKKLGMDVVPYLIPQIYAENCEKYSECLDSFYADSAPECFADFICSSLLKKLSDVLSENICRLRDGYLRAHLNKLLEEKKLIKRQHGFLCMLHERGADFAHDELQLKKPFTTYYSKVSRTTTARDIKKFYEMRLIKENEGRYSFNYNLLSL